MNKFYIYAHKIPSTSEIFYIGKGCGKRAYHAANRNLYWKNIVEKYGYKVEFLHTGLEESEAYKMEMTYIDKLCPKANLSSGGRYARSGVLLSSETKNKIKNSNIFTQKQKRKKIICVSDEICFFSMADAARFYNTSKSAVSRAVRKERNTLFKKTFDFIEAV